MDHIIAAAGGLDPADPVDSFGSAARDPPAATPQQTYPDEYPSGNEDEEEEEEEHDESNSFVKMEDSHSHAEEPGKSEQNELEETATDHPETAKPPEEVDENDQEEEEEDLALPMLGGTIDKRAYCLLDGIFEKDGHRKRITIPLTRLPAVLGRSHSTGDINFFSLGPAKALSRQHCVIDYRDDVGGKLVTPKSALKDTEEERKLDYENSKPFTVVNPPTSDVKQEDDNKENKNNFPPRGAFVLEALGKNLIMVGSQRLRQGEIAILQSGTPIRMSAYSLYFLLPTDTADPPKTLDIPLQNKETNNIGGFKRKMPGSQTSDIPKPKVKKPKAAPFAQLQAELDALPIGTLLERMNEAVESERWERKHQLIGSTISLHAVKDATSASTIREQAADGGVARTEIMRWIKESPKYSAWVEQMMSKMEAKSYQNTITKALLKAGNVRTGSGGRYIKWILPGVKLKAPGEGGGDADKKPKDGAGNKDQEEEEEEEEEEEGEEKGEEEEEDEGEGAGGDPENDEEQGGEHEEHHHGNDNEEAEGDDDESMTREGEKEAPLGAAPSNFADFAEQQEESEEDESMARDGASFEGEAESGAELGHEGHEGSSRPGFHDDESIEERGDEGIH